MPRRLQTKDKFGAIVLQGSFVLAFVCACSSGGTGVVDGSGGALPGGTGGQAGTATGGQTGSGTGGSGTATGGSGTSTGGSGTSTGGTGVGGSDTGSGGDDAGSGGDANGSGGDDAGSGGNDPGDPEVTVLLAGDNVNSNGPLDTTVESLTFSGGGHILVRPTQITSEPNTKHPVAIWGPGGSTPPTDYLQLLERMASQGFVIVGIRESTGDSVLMSAAIDWLEEQNDDTNSPMYDRLILDRVGVFGHSMGGLSSEATARDDDRVITALLDNSGSLSHNGLVDVTVPVGLIYGETGQEKDNARADYANSGNQGPLWLSMMTGGGHGSGPWDGAAANVAWMRWHLGGENFRKEEFLAEGGDYTTGIWVSEWRQWDDWTNWNE